MAVRVERVGREARDEAVGDARCQQQFVQHDRMQTAVEGRFDRAAILPQGNGVALFGVDLLVGVRDVAGDEFCQRQGILPRRGIAAQQRVEAEMVADFAGAHAVLPVGEAELYGVGGIGCGRAQQFGALFRQQGVERTGDLLPEYEAGEQEGCQQQYDERSEDDPRDFQGFFHGSKVFPAAKIQHRIEKRSGLRQECCRLAFRAVPAGRRGCRRKPSVRRMGRPRP